MPMPASLQRMGHPWPVTAGVARWWYDPNSGRTGIRRQFSNLGPISRSEPGWTSSGPPAWSIRRFPGPGSGRPSPMAAPCSMAASVPRPGCKLRGGENLRLTLPGRSEAIAPEEGSLAIVYRDASLVVLDKPPHLTVHPAAGLPDGTLVNRLIGHFPQLLDLAGPRSGHRPSAGQGHERIDRGGPDRTGPSGSERNLCRQARKQDVSGPGPWPARQGRGNHPSAHRPRSGKSHQDGRGQDRRPGGAQSLQGCLDRAGTPGPVSWKWPSPPAAPIRSGSI